MVRVEDSLSDSPEGIICRPVFGVGDDDILSQQVKCLIHYLAYWSLLARPDQVRRIDRDLKVRGLHRSKQRMVAFGTFHCIGSL